MKKGKIVLPVILLSLLAAIVALFVRFYPAWKSAETLQDHLDLAHFAYEIEVELNEDELPEELSAAFEMVSKMTGIEKADMCRLTVKGTVWEDKIHAQIYPDGATNPLTEYYFSDDTDAMNEAIFYNTVREHLVGENELLSFLVPVQEEDVYMTLKQAEQLTGIDMSNMGSFSLPLTNEKVSQKEYFLVLAEMARKKQESGNRFELAMEQIQAGLEISAAEDVVVTVEFAVQEPAEALAEVPELLSKLGIEMPPEQLRVLKSFSVTVVAGEVEEPVMPTKFVNQDMINILSGVREVIEQFLGK